MQSSIFGTDGIRGLVNSYPITAEIALKIGTAIGVYVSDTQFRKRVVIAKDTRLSGYMIEPALTSGLISSGIDVILVGPMPTPSVPMLIKSLRADFGIMITASHNPYHDNGVKLFDKEGCKLDKPTREKLEKLIFSPELANGLAEPQELGRAKRLEDAPGRYIEHVKTSFPKELTLLGLKVVIDCANGSAYKLAPTILWELGAEVTVLGCEPNGFNINHDCGSMHPRALAQKVREMEADVGIALDGDADRVVICDENGKVIKGDHIIGMIAKHLKDENKLKGDAIVVTHISNTALEDYLKSIGIKTIYSNVGDINVHQKIRENDLNFGGEESGHIIFADYSNTGDGIVSTLQILAILVESQKKLSEFADIFTLNPQMTHNLAFQNKDPLQDPKTIAKIRGIQDDNADLKIIVRKSGTENLIRILVEGKEKDRIAKTLDELIRAIQL
ncbi:phosphoglucosamine mutase [Candidatus Bandiella euplotis]|uniref:Phosphoglucosamine mutase n=1 Tax=Candidatus Bandiella euplotis TaxID=1664265 RepID=A0ABZ0UMD9_9RICK|nr:phosphoglucosamine mutase [Candidatus Bandiella woodruffii]WPX96228.1 Phosphoglucosamine mutase [Candidatus Bandiella woodruffii]